jgi:hypothetical protein
MTGGTEEFGWLRRPFFAGFSLLMVQPYEATQNSGNNHHTRVGANHQTAHYGIINGLIHIPILKPRERGTQALLNGNDDLGPWWVGRTYHPHGLKNRLE